MTALYAFEAELFNGLGTWVFVRIPNEIADEIEDSVPSEAGFGSVRVTVRMGRTEWKTSLFPDKDSQSYLLPIKKAVRVAENVDLGDRARIELSPLIE